jgi:uncharacterized membrane protein
VSKNRLEAFTDAVIAVLITIMVLDLRPPGGTDVSDLRPLLPKISVYLLSFVFLGIYWNNHHHLMQAVDRISGGVMWANLHLLFWLSLTPLATAWMGPHLDKSAPVGVYGVVLLGAAVAFSPILTRTLLAANGPDSRLARALGNDFKGNLSVIAYVVAIAVSPFVPLLSVAVYVAVAAMWLVPDRRFERVTLPGADDSDSA